LFALISWLTLTDWLLVIDWCSCQRPAALYRASGNCYFPFAHGALNLSTPGSKSMVPVCPTCPSRTASNWSSVYCCRPDGSHDAFGTPFSPAPVEFLYFLLHTALSLCTQSLHSLILHTLISKLSFWVLSPTMVSKPYFWVLSLTALRRAVTTRIHRVSSKRPAMRCYGCWNLWELFNSSPTKLTTSTISTDIYYRLNAVSIVFLS